MNFSERAITKWPLNFQSLYKIWVQAWKWSLFFESVLSATYRCDYSFLYSSGQNPLNDITYITRIISKIQLQNASNFFPKIVITYTLLRKRGRTFYNLLFIVSTYLLAVEIIRTVQFTIWEPWKISVHMGFQSFVLPVSTRRLNIWAAWVRQTPRSSRSSSILPYTQYY